MISVLAVAITYSLFLSEPAVSYEFPNGDKSFAASGAFRNASIVGLTYAVIAYTYFTYKIFRDANPSLKYWAKINFAGAIILGPIAFLTFLTRINRMIPGLTEFIFGTGVLITTYAFSQKPQLFYVLPFRAIKLLVIKQGSGLAIYTYSWVEDELEVQAPLFSSAVESINAFSRSAIDKGNIIEITFERAILLIQIPTNQELYYALLATKSSHTLKSGLQRFSKMFYSSFRDNIDNQVVVETSALDPADDLILQCFPYIPKSTESSD